MAPGLYRSEKRAVAPFLVVSPFLFVLGAALLALGSRSLSGRVNTRKLLIQLVAAQAFVVGASFFALRDMQRAELDWQRKAAARLASLADRELAGPLDDRVAYIEARMRTAA